MPLKVPGQWSFTPNYYQYDASTIGTNSVYRLLEDPYGFIWMVSDKGILIFNGKSFETVKIPGDEQEIVNICRYKNTLFASSYAGRLYEIDMLSLAIKEVKLPAPAINEAIPFKIMNVIDNKLYLVKTTTSTFLILDLKKKYKPIFSGHGNDFPKILLQDDLSNHDERFNMRWMKAVNNKLYAKHVIYELINRKLTIFYSADKDSLKYKIVSSHLQDGADLYVGFLQSGGLIKYTNYNRHLNFNNAQTILPNVEVGDILQDSKGNIWVSTMHDGVFIFSENRKKVQKLSTPYNIYSNDIWYINCKNKTLDIGYKQLVVDQLRDGKIYKRWIGDTTINFNPVFFFSDYQNKAVIFGRASNYTTYDNVKYEEMGFAYKDYYTQNNEIYATVPGGFRKFSTKLDPGFVVYHQEKFNTIFLLPDSTYARGGPSGLYLNNTATKIKSSVTKVRGYNGDILACTDNGLYIKRGEKYFFINETNGLPNNQCIQIEYFGDGYYKLLTKRGLAYIDTATCKVAGVFNTNSLGKDVVIHLFDVENDTIWLATNKGIYILDEQLIFNRKKNTATPYLYPEKLQNRNARYTQHFFETGYTKAKQVKMLLELLDFSTTNYTISYQVEKDNSIVTERSQVVNNTFVVNTPEPGDYIIKVYISSYNNHIEKVLDYTITIIPLWYQTLGVRFLFAITLLVLLGLTIRSITRYVIKGKEKRLKEKYATLQLQSQAFFTQLNPHFIFNALTPLQSHILKNEKIESLEYLDRFSSLMRDILKNSDKTETSLKKELEFINKYINIQQIRFTPSFIFELHIDPDINQDNTFLPAMLLQPIIENAIEHGVKNKGAEGLISVHIQTTVIKGQECLQIEIGDNGVGIKHDFLKEGHALYILQKRIQTLQKRAGTIASLTHQPGKNRVGTVFTLLLSKTKNLWML